jgi:CubicO group peptidase (beta-lactamase class C family)
VFVGSAVLALVVVGAAYFGWVRPTLAEAPIGTGYVAAWMCSGVLVSGRVPEDLWLQEFGPETDPLLAQFKATVDRQEMTTRAHLWGLALATAVYREGLGCTLALGRSMSELRGEGVHLEPIDEPPDLPWPQGRRVDLEILPPAADREALESVLDDAFTRPATGPDPRTRAVVVVHGGRIIAERAVEPYTVHTPLYGASMSKTVTAMLIGRLVGEGRLALEQTGLRPEWTGVDDPRRAINLDHLLRMSSGLHFTEVYEGASNVNRMLFLEPDMAAYAASQPLAAEPGRRWSYSSGTSNILMAVARETFDDDQAYWRFPHDALFGPLGCPSAVFQTDTSGTFVGSSYAFASARDWARLGLLLLRDGVWGDKRLLPEGWVDYMRTPAPADPQRHYGAQTWLEGATGPDEPAPVFEMRGHGGQFVTVIPEVDLVVVRLGWQNLPGGWDHRAFVERVAAAIGYDRPRETS